MANPHGSWIWYELMTPDAQASRAFYEGVVGWTIDTDSMMPGPVEYRLIHGPQTAAGGMLTLSPEMLANGAKPGWIGYLGVDDVDAAVDRLQALGGTVHVPAMDAPGVGRMAMVADPQGVPFYLMRGASDEASGAYGRMALGHTSWNELQTSDADAGFAFYADLFGWQKAGGMPMPWGEYSFLRTAADAEVFGAMMPVRDADHPRRWTFYFRVPDAAAAHERVRQYGGTPLSAPNDVPGGERVFHALDPHGVTFGLVAPA